MENGGKPRSSSRRVWRWRIVYIVYSLEVGSFLVILPSLPFWDNNYLLYRFPSLRPLVVNPFLKGAVLGLGIVNLLIGLYEIVRFRKGSRSFFSR
jgi:hypothetical protein